MADKWHDINHPGVWRKPKTDKPNSGTTAPADSTADDAPPENKQPLVKLSEGKFVPPDEGAEINKKCPVQVNVEYLDDSAKSMQKVTFSLYANYNDTTSNLSHYVDGYEDDGVATAEMTMYPPPDYQDGDSVDYFFKAEHIRGEKVIDSEDLTLPQETREIVLQKGDYDENGAQAYNKDQSGDNFKPNNVVKKLQGDLITTNFLPQGSDDGFFGDDTEKAVNDFQDYAIKLVRMKRSVGKTENTDTGLDQESPDGIVSEKTRDELDKWLSNDWVKPIPTLRHGEYDDTGVDNGKGKKGTDEHHQGAPVVEAQQNLQKVGVYTDGAVDGWFYDKMLCGVNDFQSAAADATFVVNGQTTQFGQKLTGYQKGDMCAATQEYLKMVVDKGGVVPNDVLTFEGTNFKYKKAAKSVDDCLKTLPKELRTDFKNKIENVIKEMYKLGFAFGVLESAKAGYRTFQMQSEISTESTNAGPGESFHNYGLAVDLGMLEWVDEDEKSYSDFWLGKMDGIFKYKGFSSKIWNKRNEIAGSDVYTLSWEIIHLQGVPAETSGREALVKAMNKAAEDSGDNLWQYRKAASGAYECTLGSEKDWKNIGTSKQMWSKTALACTDDQRSTVRNHMEKAEQIALTIEP